MGRPVPVHYLRPNETEWSPRSVAFFDTESTLDDQGDRVLHTLRLWCGDAVRRDLAPDRQPPGQRQDGRDGASLAQWLAGRCRGPYACWAYAHNLSYDLTTSRLLDHLADAGWSVSEFGVTDRNPWFRLGRGAKRLTLVDSWSWLPTALERIGELVGVRKPALPTWAADDAEWLVRCYGDVDVTRVAVLTLMDWWDTQGLGRWSITGASTGWNAMRHMSRRKSWLIRPDPDATSFERRAVRGGRRDVWRTGQLEQGPYAHLDVERAHATIAEHLLLPTRRLGHFDHLDPGDPVWTNRAMGVIARCRVRCTAPHWPVRLTGNTWWPTGEFTTTLAGPELHAARERGELVSVGEGYRYRLGIALTTWARWANRLAAGATPDAPSVARLAAKSWGRSVIGKFAAHASTLRVEGVALTPTPTVEQAWSLGTHTRATIVDIGGQRYWVTHDLDGDDAFPAVLAWVESELRVRMLAAIDHLGASVVVSVDTDGVIVDLPRAILRHSAGPRRQGHPASADYLAGRLCRQLSPLVAPLVIRPTATYDRIVIDGPQNLTLGGQRRMAGVPRQAVEVAPKVYRAATWPKLRWQLTHGDPAGYIQPRVTYRPGGAYVRRWVTVTGQAVPPEARVDDQGVTHLLPWSTTGGGHGDLALAEVQHPVLTRLH